MRAAAYALTPAESKQLCSMPMKMWCMIVMGCLVARVQSLQQTKPVLNFTTITLPCQDSYSSDSVPLRIDIQKLGAPKLKPHYCPARPASLAHYCESCRYVCPIVMLTTLLTYPQLQRMPCNGVRELMKTMYAAQTVTLILQHTQASTTPHATK